jgi:hypothetical protein
MPEGRVCGGVPNAAAALGYQCAVEAHVRRAKSIDGAEHRVSIDGVMAGARTPGLQPSQTLCQQVGHVVGHGAGLIHVHDVVLFDRHVIAFRTATTC